MIKKLVHFSDLHIRLFKDHDLYRSILEDAINQWKETKPDRIVFTGDLVHSKNQMTPELIEMVSWILKECSYIAKTIIIPGNHDFLVNNIDRLDALSPIIESLNNNNIVYYKDRGVYEDENVSWCVYSQYQGNIPPDISEAKGIKVGLFHGPIQGMTTDLGYDFGDHAYDVEKFDGLDIVLCGDIHKRQEFSFKTGKGYMIGSPIQQNIGESIRNHGFGTYDFGTKEYIYTDLENPKNFHSAPESLEQVLPPPSLQSEWEQQEQRRKESLQKDLFCSKLNYFTGRSFEKDVKIKYKNPSVSRDIIPFELFINWDIPFILCEGPFDAIAIKRNVIPLLGKNIQSNLMKKIVMSSVEKIYIALDKDAQKQALSFCERLMNEGKEVYLVDMHDKDPSELLSVCRVVVQ